jgi:hypothetical protein
LVTTPAVVIRPIELLLMLVNHKAPSGPAVIPYGASLPRYSDTTGEPDANAAEGDTTVAKPAATTKDAATNLDVRHQPYDFGATPRPALADHIATPNPTRDSETVSHDPTQALSPNQIPSNAHTPVC